MSILYLGKDNIFLYKLTIGFFSNTYHRFSSAIKRLHTICTHTNDISLHNYENDEANIERPLINRNNINMHTWCHKENEL